MIEATALGSAYRREAVIQRDSGTTVREPRKRRRYTPSASLDRFLRSKYLEQSATPMFLVPVAAGPLAYPVTGYTRTAPGDRRPAQSEIVRILRTAAKLAVLVLTLVLFGAVAFESQAHAGPILAEAGVFVGETAAQYSLNVSGAGLLNINLIDYGWPGPLTDLTLEIASPTKILGEMTGAGQDTVSVSGPGTYYAYITGRATGAYGIGAYGFIADFQPLGQPTPVPLPASISLLLGGLAATLWFARRKAHGDTGSLALLGSQ